MTREITRPTDYSSREEAKRFGGPYWENWRHSLLSYLGVDDFPSGEVEEILREWWRLRMSLRLGIVTKEEFDNRKNTLFPDYPDGDPRDVLSDPFISKAVRYITEKTAPGSKNY